MTEFLAPILAGALGAIGGALLRLAGGDDLGGGVHGVACLIAGYVFSQFLMFKAFNRALRVLSLLEANVSVLAANTVTSGLLGSVLFNEAITVRWVCGSGLVLIGSWMVGSGKDGESNAKKAE